MTLDLRLEQGWVEPRLGEEFPALRLRVARVEATAGRRSPRVVRDRLRLLSNRFTGGLVVNLRQQPIPWAYRVFFRQIGMDPDEQPTPIEAMALERMKHGGFPSRNLVDDALTIATAETGVAVLALDAARVEGQLGLRLSRRGERLGLGRGEGPPAGSRPLSAHQILVADAVRSLAVLFGDVADGRGVHPHTERMALCAVQVKGVPPVSAEEALWVAAEVLESGQ